MSKLALRINVRVDDWTAERANIASNVIIHTCCSAVKITDKFNENDLQVRKPKK